VPLRAAESREAWGCRETGRLALSGRGRPGAVCGFQRGGYNLTPPVLRPTILRVAGVGGPQVPPVTFGVRVTRYPACPRSAAPVGLPKRGTAALAGRG